MSQILLVLTQNYFVKHFVLPMVNLQELPLFDMILFEIPEKWSEGNGYDYVESNLIIQANKQTRVFC